MNFHLVLRCSGHLTKVADYGGGCGAWYPGYMGILSGLTESTVHPSSVLPVSAERSAPPSYLQLEHTGSAAWLYRKFRFATLFEDLRHPRQVSRGIMKSEYHYKAYQNVQVSNIIMPQLTMSHCHQNIIRSSSSLLLRIEPCRIRQLEETVARPG